MKLKNFFILLLTALILTSGGDFLYAASKLDAPVQELIDTFASEAKKEVPGFKGFSSEEGKKLFFMKRIHSVKKEERSCTTCHTKDPSQPGRTTAGKSIEPISPAVTKGRFTDPKKVEKWFKRNCKWVLERVCTSKEKGDFITFMLSL